MSNITVIDSFTSTTTFASTSTLVSTSTITPASGAVILYTSSITETPSPPPGGTPTPTILYTSVVTETPSPGGPTIAVIGVVEPDGSTSFSTTQIYATGTDTAQVPKAGSPTDIGTIIGATVGVILGFLLLCSLVFLLFLRRRRAKKRRLETQDTTQEGDGPAEAEKAQLHSDEVKPIRMELEGDLSDAKIRQIGEVMEMPANEPVETNKELPANEIVGSEMDTARPNRVNNDGPVKRKDLPLSSGPVDMHQADKSKSAKTSL